MTQTPTEAAECVALASWLDRHEICYTHVPMGSSRSKQAGAVLKRMGAKAGVPDYLIFDCPNRPNWGVALEMKRRTGGRVDPLQRAWLAKLEQRGWLPIVAYGAEDAIEQLKSLGYGTD